MKVKCPRCGAVLKLKVPASAAAKLRCPACRCVFRVQPAKTPSVEEAVADWLSGSPEEEQTEARAPAPLAGGAPMPPPPKAPQGVIGPLRLVSVERRGALFEFPADYLRQDAFRCSMPRACVHCLARAHLTAHVIIYDTQLRDSVSLEDAHAAGQISIPQEAISKLEGSEMLKLLPEVPGVPTPGKLPMPYWVCDLCKGVGWISGQIQANPETGKGFCRLLIRNVKLALGFLAAAAGKEGRDYVKLKEFVDHMEEDPWDGLPSVARHRVEQWFRPRDEERFLAYVPDRAFVRTEDGMNGLAISDQRLVYHHPPLHQELSREKELTIQVRLAEGKEVATIEGADFKKRGLALDRGGMMLLRRALSKGGYKAKWV